MNILYIHQYFLTPHQAGSTRSYWLASALVANGCRVVMLTSRNQQVRWIEQEWIDGIQVIYIKNAYRNNMSIGRRLWSFGRFMLLATWVGMQQKPVDLIYATSTPLSVGIPALLIKAFRRTPFLFEVRDLWPEVPIQMGAVKNGFVIKVLRWLEKTIYHSARHLVALSPGIRRGITKAGIASDKITLIPNMAKNDIFSKRVAHERVAREFGINTQHFNAIYFGAMGEANGLEYVLEAAKILKDRQVTTIDFILLGAGKMEPELKSKSARANLSTVKFLGSHPLTTVSEIVNLCDCSLVLFADVPVLTTNSPNKLFDSLSAGKPLIVNSAGWTKEMVEAHQCGVYVAPQQPEELADTLLKMVADPAWLHRMSANSRRLAEEVYDKTILCNKFVHLITAHHVPKPVKTFS